MTSGGGLNGGELLVAVISGSEPRPQVACAPSGSYFMVAYHDSDDARVYGRRVNATAGMMADAFAISGAYSENAFMGLSLAWGDDRYLVTWMDSRNLGGSTGYDIYGQYVNASGGLIDDNFAVNAASGTQEFPYVAGNTANGSFLATWGYTSGGTNFLGASLLNVPEPEASAGSSGGSGCFVTAAGGSMGGALALLAGLLAAAGLRRPR